MRRELIAGLVCLALVFAGAGLLIPPAGGRAPGHAGGAAGDGAGAGREDSSSAQRAAPKRPLRVLGTDGTVETLELEDYVYHVLMAEMPASFDSAALAAQAVAARTYAVSRAKNSPHAPRADVCADFTCCQGYADTLPADWGDSAPAYAAKLRRAAEDTAGEVLCWEGEPIQAVFHSSSHGLTASAQAVWGQAVPYLVSVTTPETALDVPRYETDVVYAPRDFKALFLAQYPAAQLSGDPGGWFSGLKRSDWGGVEAVTVGGVGVSGADLRSLCALRSTRFTVEADESAVTFHVTAYGHGVGMSQYGANVMAKEGCSYRDILAHYYPGAVISEI